MRTGCTPGCSPVTFLPSFSICSEGGNIAGPVKASVLLQGHGGMSWRANWLKHSLDPFHLVFGESTPLCLGPNLFVFAHVLRTAEMVSDVGNKTQQVVCTFFLLFLLQPVFAVFYCLSYWQPPLWSPLPAFFFHTSSDLTFWGWRCFCALLRNGPLDVEGISKPAHCILPIWDCGEVGFLLQPQVQTTGKLRWYSRFFADALVPAQCVKQTSLQVWHDSGHEWNGFCALKREGPHLEACTFKGGCLTELKAIYLWGQQSWKIKGRFSKLLSRGWVNAFWSIPMNFLGMSIASAERFWNPTYPSSDTFWKMCVLSTHSLGKCKLGSRVLNTEVLLRNGCFKRRLREWISKAILRNYSGCPGH